MTSSNPSQSSLPASMGPGARTIQPGESPQSLLAEISEIRSHYNVHIGTNAIELAYQLNGQQRHYNIPMDNVPVGNWTRALCWGGPSTAKISGTLLIDMIRATENISGRRITQEEAEGMAFYSSRRMMTMYFGQVAAIGLGIGSAWWGRKEMKFPFMRPKDPSRYESFPMRVIPILKGQPARIMWHITRANIYTVMWLFLTNPLFRSVADVRLTVGLYNDSRTHDLAKSIRGKDFDRLRANRATGAAKPVQSGPPPTSDSQPFDDASPSVYGVNEDYGRQSDYNGGSTFTDGRTDTGLMSDSSAQQGQTTSASPNSWSRAQTHTSRPAAQQQSSVSSDSSDFFFDDASPTAGNDPDMTTSRSYERQRSGGSAWDRIRRGGSSQSQAQKAQQSNQWYGNQSPEFETKSDSFSFSSGEEEKRLAKEQAQKEFNALVERERRESGSADYSRDMRATETGEDPRSGEESAWARRRRG